MLLNGNITVQLKTLPPPKTIICAKWAIKHMPCRPPTNLARSEQSDYTEQVATVAI